MVQQQVLDRKEGNLYPQQHQPNALLAYRQTLGAHRGYFLIILPDLNKGTF